MALVLTSGNELGDSLVPAQLADPLREDHLVDVAHLDVAVLVNAVHVALVEDDNVEHVEHFLGKDAQHVLVVQVVALFLK